MMEFWFSDAAQSWLVADAKTGNLIAQFRHQAQLTFNFPDAVHNKEQCDREGSDETNDAE